jgi:hypothetical protein
MTGEAITTGREGEPFLVEPGWEWCDIIRWPGLDSFRLLYYPNGDVRFEHRCHDPIRGDKICAPLLAAHTITRNDVGTHANPKGEPTVTPSLDCPDCPLHGHIVDGWWRG